MAPDGLVQPIYRMKTMNSRGKVLGKAKSLSDGNGIGGLQEAVKSFQALGHRSLGGEDDSNSGVQHVVDQAFAGQGAELLERAIFV